MVRNIMIGGERKNIHLLIDLFLLVLGLSCVLASGYFTHIIFKNLFQALGTGLIVAGLVSLMIGFLHTEKKSEEIKLIDPRRIRFEKKYDALREKTRTLDIVGIALTGALNSLINNEKLLRNVFFEKGEIRLMFLSPSAPYVEQRAREDGVPESELKDILKGSIRLSEKIYAKLKKLYEEHILDKKVDKEKIGFFEIRILDACPYCTVFRTDDKILWGIYTCSVRGTESSVLEVDRERGELGQQLGMHFERLWELSRRNCLVRYHRDYKPTLDENLLEKLLSNDSD